MGIQDYFEPVSSGVCGIMNGLLLQDFRASFGQKVNHTVVSPSDLDQRNLKAVAKVLRKLSFGG